MEIKYTPSRADYIAYHTFLEEEKGPGWFDWPEWGDFATSFFQVVLACLILFCSLVVILYVLHRGTRELMAVGDDPPGHWPAIVTSVGFVCWLVAVPLAIRFSETKAQRINKRATRMVKKKLARGEINLGYTVHLTVKAEGLSQVMELEDRRDGVRSTIRKQVDLPWGLVDEVRVADGYAMIMTPGDVLMVIPRRLFADAGSFEAFVAEIRNRYEEEGAQTHLREQSSVVTSIKKGGGQSKGV
jgi:hypothetical protein